MKIAILLSGGVDSSVAASLLAADGEYELAAFYLKIWLEDELAGLGDCPWEEDLGYARAVCRQLGLPLEVVPFQREYQERVVAYTLAELRAGRTPSSDLLCNREVKFGVFLDTIGSGFDRVASGHYARRTDEGGLAGLAKSPDPVKDQTYFLARLRQDQLRRCLFPLGPYDKRAVRAMARERALATADRPDSQGICFLGKIPFDAFVRHHLGERSGEIREVGSGRRLGHHRGHWFYTIGQRRGLGLSGGPWFVVGKDPEDNVVLVIHELGLPAAAVASFEVEDLHWLGETPDESWLRTGLEVKLRHGPATLPARLEPLAGGHGRVFLEGSDPGVAPGQFAVFYRGHSCLGSGVIR